SATGVVNLAGGTLSGIGHVGSIVNVSGGKVAPGYTAQGGTTIPGPTSDNLTVDHASAANPAVNFAAANTYYVNLNLGENKGGTAGVNNSLLTVNGNVTLGNANLNGIVAVGVVLGDTFTILKTTGTGLISGTFNSTGGVVFIGGQKFGI